MLQLYAQHSSLSTLAYHGQTRIATDLHVGQMYSNQYRRSSYQWYSLPITVSLEEDNAYVVSIYRAWKDHREGAATTAWDGAAIGRIA